MKTRLMAITIMLATMVSLMGCGSGDVATESETASADVKVSDTAASAVQTGSSEKRQSRQ